MADISPFRPYRYDTRREPLAHLVTQPYDKITPAMRTRYEGLSPHNLVRIILGQQFGTGNGTDNVYTRAAQHLQDWIGSGVLLRDEQPALYAYFQRFSVPDTGEVLERKGFIGLGPVDDYANRVVHPHERTLTGPKKDRLELLRHTRAHFGQIFMLYPDPELAIDRLLDEAAEGGAPDEQVEDEYGGLHRVWRIAHPGRVREIQDRMRDKKLLIADGHHRYETAQAFRQEHPDLRDAQKVMMTFVNMHSPGLQILGTHRLLNDLPGFDRDAFTTPLGARKLGSIRELRHEFERPAPDKVRIGVALAGNAGILLYERDRRPQEIDVRVLHDELLAGLLGVSEEAVREEKHIRYVRGLDAAYEQVRAGEAQLGFLLEPTTIEQVADVAFAGGVMPQKSTDFYPKLLSGITIYPLER